MDALVKMVYYYIITKRQEGQKRNDKGQIIDERSKNSNNNIEEDSKRIFRNSSKGLNGSEETEYIPIPVLDGNMLTYFHIGNLAKQCLCHGYKIGVWQLDCTSKAKEILSLNNYGQADPDFYNVSGGVSLIEKFGILNMSQTWQTDGYIGTIGLDTEAKGRKLYSILSGNYLRDGDPGPKVELFAGYERSPIKSEVVIPILKSPTLMGYLLFQPKEHFVFACRMEFNVEDREIETHAFSIGYNDDITEYMLKIENFTDVRGSVFQRIGDKWAVALKANLFGKDMQKFTVGGQYQLNENALIKARICSIGLIGLVYQFKITENVKGNYYFGLDASSPLKGDHKIGISWKFKS